MKIYAIYKYTYKCKTGYIIHIAKSYELLINLFDSDQSLSGSNYKLAMQWNWSLYMYYVYC